MLTLKRSRQIFATFADDTRLRIVNLLRTRQLTVAEICKSLGRNQSIISKHLSKMRLLGILGDRREGPYVYYYLPKYADAAQSRLIMGILDCLKPVTVFREDRQKLGRLTK